MSDVQAVSPEAAERSAMYDRSTAARAKMADAKTYQEFADAAVEQAEAWLATQESWLRHSNKQVAWWKDGLKTARAEVKENEGNVAVAKDRLKTAKAWQAEAKARVSK